MSRITQAILQQGQRASPPLRESAVPIPEPAGGKPPYEACAASKVGHDPVRLRIDHGNGLVTMPAYTYLADVLRISPELITLVFTDVLYTLSGHNLDSVLDEIEYHKAARIYRYNAHRFAPPADGAAVITGIDRLELKELGGLLDTGKKPVE